MKVCQLVPEMDSGGVERGTVELSHYLEKNGHQSLVISGGGRLVNLLAGEHIELAIGKKKLSSLKYIKQLRKIFQSCDVVHSRSRLPAWLTYLAWKRMPKAKRPLFVTTVHGFNSVSRYSKIMTYGDCVITVSQCVKDYVIRHYGVDENKITVIHRGVDFEEYNRQLKLSASWLLGWEKLYSPTEYLNLLLPGRITQLKGIEHFIQAIYCIKLAGIPVRGFIVGGVHPKRKKYYELLKKMVISYKLTGEIIFIEHRSDLREIMLWSDIVCNTTLQQESFGRTCNEALALGKPFIGYNHGGIAEQLKILFPEGCVDVGDYKGLAQKAIEWSRNMPIIPDVKPFSLDIMCEKIVDVYQNAISSEKN